MLLAMMMVALVDNGGWLCISGADFDDNDDDSLTVSGLITCSD